MGFPIYLAVPDEQDFDSFAGLCSTSFAKATVQEFLAAVELEAEHQRSAGRRVIGVPMDVEDFAAWLGGREATRDLWLAYAADRAEGVRRWPPGMSRFFMSTGGRC